MLENPMYLADPPEPEPFEETDIEEADALQEALDEAKADWIEPECNCWLEGDQADASDCPLHGGNR